VIWRGNALALTARTRIELRKRVGAAGAPAIR